MLNNIVGRWKATQNLIWETALCNGKILLLGTFSLWITPVSSHMTFINIMIYFLCTRLSSSIYEKQILGQENDINNISPHHGGLIQTHLFQYSSVLKKLCAIQWTHDSREMEIFCHFSSSCYIVFFFTEKILFITVPQ